MLYDVDALNAESGILLLCIPRAASQGCETGILNPSTHKKKYSHLVRKDITPQAFNGVASYVGGAEVLVVALSNGAQLAHMQSLPSN